MSYAGHIHIDLERERVARIAEGAEKSQPISKAEPRPQGQQIIVDELGGVAFRPKISNQNKFAIR